MKKIIAICFSLILVLASFASSFAATEVFEVDKFTGEIIKSSTGYTTNTVALSGSCSYDVSSKTYIYSTSSSELTNIKSNVFDGMITSDIVSVESEIAAQIVIYKEGKEINSNLYSRITEPGVYVVRTVNEDKQVFTFTIVGQRSGLIYAYDVPGIFNISKATKDNQEIKFVGRHIDMSEEGQYCVRYKCPSTGVVEELNVYIDHTAPELVINGVENGIARKAVTIGEIEQDSTLVLTRDDGEIIDYTEPIKIAGDYTAVYTDVAGNGNTYYFTVKVFLDGGAWIFVGLAAAVVILAVGYMIFCKKNMRTR